MSKSDHLRGRAGAVGFLVILAIAVLPACAFPNPRDCLDGICSNPSRPFCDEDGAVSGLDHTCMAVACVAKSFAACRGDSAVVCDADGANYDVVSCPLGCDAASSGCRECTNDQLCNAPRTVCDAGTHLCRGCRIDDECESKVCDLVTGSCVPESSIIYASPNGVSQCSLATPCSITNAIVLARNATQPPIIRMLPGLYTTTLDVKGPSPGPITVVATGAQIVPNDSSQMAHALSVRDGANVRIRNLTTLSPLQILCDTSSAAISTLVLERSSLVSSANGTAMTLAGCKLTLSSVDVSLNVCEIAINATGNVNVDADRVRIVGNNNPHILASGTQVSMRVTNSLFDDVLLDLDTTDTTDPGSSFLFGYDTFFLSISGLRCDGDSVHKSVYFENSIIAGAGHDDVIVGSSCRFSNTIVSRQFSGRLGTIVEDPRFVDLAGHDFHLQPGSPAIDASVRSSSGLDATADLDGIARPQGDKADVGAYELRH